ncbi:MAG: glutamine synthetase [Alphaproteobacteria bacterium]|nr:glutamine synthetase [Alphaproteobacteria bacterium]
MDAWLKERQVDEVECLVPDLAGIPRGKILPAAKFIKSIAGGTLRLPEAILGQTVTGDSPDTDAVDATDPDIQLVPDPRSLRLVPWYQEPTAQVICDCTYADGRPVDIAPRYVLQQVVELYAARGWRPIVAPELEFFLVAVNTDPDYPLEPPIGRSGRAETGRQAYGIDAVNEFDPLFEEVYDFCEVENIDIDTLSHEAGAAQIEINFNHGDPILLADQALLFKRTVRQAALRQKIYATFMAKPMEREAGSAMHLHQSVVDATTGLNLFADDDGNDTPLFHAHIAGLQKYLPAAMPLLAPYVNSYRRLMRHSDAPINVHWGVENRTVGLRVPRSGREGRRVENRVAGADVNPYLAIAASLACGYLGMVDKLEPSKPITGSGYTRAHGLPRYLPDALDKLADSKPLKRILGERFVQLLLDVKEAEHDAYQAVISSWEREHLLLNV